MSLPDVTSWSPKPGSSPGLLNLDQVQPSLICKSRGSRSMGCWVNIEQIQVKLNNPVPVIPQSCISVWNRWCSVEQLKRKGSTLMSIGFNGLALGINLESWVAHLLGYCVNDVPPGMIYQNVSMAFCAPRGCPLQPRVNQFHERVHKAGLCMPLQIKYFWWDLYFWCAKDFEQKVSLECGKANVTVHRTVWWMVRCLSRVPGKSLWCHSFLEATEMTMFRWLLR